MVSKNNGVWAFLVLCFLIHYGVASYSHLLHEHHTVWLASPIDDSYTNQNNDSLVFIFNHTGYLAGIVNCTLFLDGDPVNYTVSVAADINTNIYSNMSITEGVRYWWVNCSNGTASESSVDVGGNHTLNVDRTAPSAGFVDPTPDDNAYITDNYTYINVSVSDTLSPNNLTAFIDWNRSLVGWWRFNREAGENDTYAVDWSSYGNNGTLTNMNHGLDNCTGNCSGWRTNGKYGKGMAFDGVDDYIDFGNDTSFDIVDEITIESWVKTADGGDIVVKQYGDTVVPYDIKLGTDVSIWVYSDSAWKHGSSAGIDVSDDNWHHFTAIYNKKWSVCNFKVYIDGVDRTFPAGCSSFTDGLPINSEPVYLGIYNTDYFNGTIDEVKIWNRALGEDEINASYNTGLYRLYHNFTNLTEGSYTYTAYTQDLAGNVNQTETRALTVEYGPPAITVVSPTYRDYAMKWVWANITLSKTASWCGVSLNGTANQTMSNTTATAWYLNLSTPSEGSNNVSFFCNDTYGNLGSSTVLFTTDTLAPIITNITLSSLTFNKTTKVNITTEFSDNVAVNTTYAISYLVSDYFGNYVCENNCFMILNRTFSATSAIVADTWDSIYYLFNSTYRVPVKVYPGGSVNGIIYGTLDVDGNSTNNDSVRVRLYVFDILNSVDSYIIQNASNISLELNYTAGVSTFTTDAPFGENKTIVMDSDFNVSNELIGGNYYINVTVYDNASNSFTNVTPLVSVTCTESWSYSAWSVCSGGIRTRDAVDSNNCGTTDNRSAISESCDMGGVSGGGSSGTGLVILPDVLRCEDDDGCALSEVCESNVCAGVVCGYCEYVKDHGCRKYDCCTDDGCTEGESCIDNECVAGKDDMANIEDDGLKDEALRAIESARNAIRRNSDVRDVGEAQRVLSEAESAYDDGDYSTAKKYAMQAKIMAEEALEIREDSDSALKSDLYLVYGAGLLILIMLVVLILKRDAIMSLLTGRRSRLHKIDEIERYIETIKPIVRKMDDKASMYERKLSGFSIINAKKDVAKRLLDGNDVKANEEIQRIVDMLADLRYDTGIANRWEGDEKGFNLHRINEIEKYIERIKPIIKEMKRKALINRKNAYLVPLSEAKKDEAKKMVDIDNEGAANEQIRGSVDMLVRLKLKAWMGSRDEKEFDLHRIDEIEKYIEVITPIIRKMKDKALIYEKGHSQLSLIEAKRDDAKRMMGKDNKRTDEDIRRIVDILASMKAETDGINRTDDEVMSYHMIDEIEQYIERIRPILINMKDEGIIDEKKVAEISLIEGKKDYAIKLLKAKSPFAQAQIDVTVDALSDFKKEIEWHIDAHRYES